MDFSWLRGLSASDWRTFTHGGAAYDVDGKEFLKRSGLEPAQDWRTRFADWGSKQPEVFILWDSVYQGRVLVTCEHTPEEIADAQSKLKGRV